MKIIKKILTTPYILLMSILGFVISLLIITRESSPALSGLNRGDIGIEGYYHGAMENNNVMGVICLCVALILIGDTIAVHYCKIKNKNLTKKVVNTLLGILVFIAGVTYFYGDRGISKLHYVKIYDSYHYLIGAKYYDELGYYGLYRCHLLADSEREDPRISSRTRVRNLETYEISDAKRELEKADRSGFSEERWKEFESDLSIFDSSSLITSMLIDHGYNGTPFHSFLAGAVANSVKLDYEQLAKSTLIDIWAICIVCMLVFWAFGWQIGCLFSIFIFTNFADRFSFIGASFFRYIWLATLVSGIAFMKKGWYKTSGFFITMSAMLNVFPILYFAGIGIKSLYQLIKERQLDKKYRHFIYSSIISAIILGVLSLTPKAGIKSYEVFWKNMSHHSGLMTSSRIGFQYNFLFKGEMTDDDTHYSYKTKAKDLAEIKLPYTILVGALLLSAFWISRRLNDVSATVFSGFLLFFMMFSTVRYYYASACLLVLLWHGKLSKRSGKLSLALLFLLMSITYYIWQETRFLKKFLNNNVMSGLFTIFLGFSLVYFSYSLGYMTKLRRLIVKDSSYDKFSDMINKYKKMVAIVCVSIILVVVGVKGAIVLLTPKEKVYQLFASGDSILSRRVHYNLYAKGPKDSLKAIAPVIKNADIAMTNLETVISNQGELYAKGGRNPYYFRGRPELLNILTFSGFDFVATANNHSMDYGPDALLEQNQILSDSHIAYAGTGKNMAEASKPTYIKTGNVTLAFISMYIGGADTEAGDSSPGIFQVRRTDQALNVLKAPYNAARKKADLVIFTPHWGPNLADAPNSSGVRLAHELIDMGFDAILGHSAHIIQGMDVYKNKPIIYDMGNFIADWISNKRMENSAYFLLDYNRYGFTKVRMIPIQLKRGGVSIPKEKSKLYAIKIFERLSQDLNSNTVMKRTKDFVEVNIDASKHEKRTPVINDSAHVSNTTITVPRKWTTGKANVVLNELPVWAKGYKPIELKQGIKIVGARNAKNVHVRSGFKMEVLLDVSHPLKGQWEVVTTGTNTETGEEFLYDHPLANGATDPKYFEEGKYFLDVTSVRGAKKVSPGTYKLFWHLRNRSTYDVIFPVDKEEPALVGTINILQGGISNLASGIDWSGEL